MAKNSGKFLDVAIVGAGAGICEALQDSGIDACVFLERETVGAAFEKWTTGQQSRYPRPHVQRFVAPPNIIN